MWPFNIFTKAVPKRDPAEQPGSPIGIWTGAASPTVTYLESIKADDALRHPVIYRCLNRIASAVSSVGWYADVDRSVPTAEQAGARQIKAINDLLQSPNDIWSRGQLLYWMALNFACYGRVPFKVGVAPTDPNLPTGIYPLTARFVKARYDGRGIIVAYQYGDDFGDKNTVIIPTRRAAKKGEAYAYEIVRPGLDAQLGGNSAKPGWQSNVNPLSAIGLPSQIITLLLQRAADTASGHPNSKYIVVCDKTLTAKQRKAVENRIKETAVDGEASGQVLFLFNTKIEVVKLDNDLKDIHSKVPLDDMARQIVGAFGIPVALIGLGASDGAKFASNYTESRRSFWEDTIIPEYLTTFSIGLTYALCPPGMKICFDYDSIQAMIDARITNAEKLGRVTYVTRDEKREITGFEPLPAGKGGDQLDFPPGSKDISQSTPPPKEDDDEQQGSIQ